MISYPQGKSKQINDLLQKKTSDHFFVGFDKDGNRMFSLKLGLNLSMPMRQRYDRYVCMIGQIQDIKYAFKDLWDEYSMAVRQKQMKQRREQVIEDDEEDQPERTA